MVVAAPFCELGCVATLLVRDKIDFVRDVIGAEWRLEASTRRLSTVPQPFLDRSDVAVSAQGRGWREVAAEVCGVEILDRRSPREEYLADVGQAVDRGGALLLVDDSQVPWLTHAAWGPGLLPHALGVWEFAATVTVVEGHSLWAGLYELTRDQLIAAAFPPLDVHGISGRHLSIDLAATVPAPERLRRAAAALANSARLSASERPVDTQVTRSGTVTTASGAVAAALAGEALGGLRYVCVLGEEAPGELTGDRMRDYQFGRYTFARLAEEVAFVAFARQASGSLLAALDAPAALRSDVDELARRWRELWRTARTLAAEPRVARLNAMLDGWRGAAAADCATARRVAEAVGG